MSRLDPAAWSDAARRYPNYTPHKYGSRTSLAAAHKLEPKRESLEDFVLSVITAAGSHGATDAEINAAARREGKTMEMRPRRAQLLEKGFVRDSGMTRPNPATGRDMTAWVLA